MSQAPTPTPPPPVTSLADSQKLRFDLYKHITTLDTVAIAFVIAIVEKGFVGQEQLGQSKPLHYALTAFCVSLVCGVVSMLVVIYWPDENKINDKGGKVLAAFAAAACWFLFLAGIWHVITAVSK